MSVQLENGFTRVANELFEIIPFYKFNGSQYAIIITVLRFTYGFNRKDHDISITFLTNSTGIKRTQVDRELTTLINSKVIKVTKESTKTEARKLGLNKHYEDWLITRRYPLIRGQSPKKSIPEKEDRESPNQGTEGIPYLEDKERKESFKDNLKNTTTSDENFDNVRIAFRELHGVIDLPMTDSPVLTKLLDENIPPDLIISVMKEKYKPSVKTIKYYIEAIKERHEGKERVVPMQRKRNEVDWDKVLRQLQEAEQNESRTGA